MPKKREYVVRVVAHHNEHGSDLFGLIECLRYAQVLRVHRNDAESVCFDIVCPPGLQSDLWAQMNADRMTSMGYNAVKAPSTGGL